MSSGGSCRSATMRMTASPCACSKPWNGERIWPKLRVLTMTLTRWSSAPDPRRISTVLSRGSVVDEDVLVARSRGGRPRRPATCSWSGADVRLLVVARRQDGQVFHYCPPPERTSSWRSQVPCAPETAYSTAPRARQLPRGLTQGRRPRAPGSLRHPPASGATAHASRGHPPNQERGHLIFVGLGRVEKTEPHRPASP